MTVCPRAVELDAALASASGRGASSGRHAGAWRAAASPPAPGGLAGRVAADGDPAVAGVAEGIGRTGVATSSLSTGSGARVGVCDGGREAARLAAIGSGTSRGSEDVPTPVALASPADECALGLALTGATDGARGVSGRVGAGAMTVPVDGAGAGAEGGWAAGGRATARDPEAAAPPAEPDAAAAARREPELDAEDGLPRRDSPVVGGGGTPRREPESAGPVGGEVDGGVVGEVVGGALAEPGTVPVERVGGGPPWPGAVPDERATAGTGSVPGAVDDERIGADGDSPWPGAVRDDRVGAGGRLPGAVPELRAGAGPASAPGAVAELRVGGGGT